MADNANLNETLAEIEIAIIVAQEKVQRGNDLEALLEDPKFIRVIQNGYLEGEAERLFSILTTPPGNRKDVLDTTHDKLSAIRHFKEYIGTPEYPGIIRREAEVAENAIEEQRQLKLRLTAPSED